MKDEVSLRAEDGLTIEVKTLEGEGLLLWHREQFGVWCPFCTCIHLHSYVEGMQVVGETFEAHCPYGLFYKVSKLVNECVEVLDDSSCKEIRERKEFLKLCRSRFYGLKKIETLLKLNQKFLS